MAPQYSSIPPAPLQAVNPLSMVQHAPQYSSILPAPLQLVSPVSMVQHEPAYVHPHNARFSMQPAPWYPSHHPAPNVHAAQGIVDPNREDSGDKYIGSDSGDSENCTSSVAESDDGIVKKSNPQKDTQNEKNRNKSKHIFHTLGMY